MKTSTTMCKQTKALHVALQQLFSVVFGNTKLGCITGNISPCHQ